ncbi:nucleotidyltransferase [miscellaneous Crenarchaeota group archaeon SMTZ-80]|nr:MAG: nucleotidyltransferase [miscellaneous Crenarchaeota group archaeon SMTZ-80]
MKKDFSRYLINADASIKEALLKINELSSDILTLFVINNEDVVIGTLTDGDIRRGLIKGCPLSDKVSLIAHKNFYYFNKDNLDLRLVKKVRDEEIKLVPFLDDFGRIVRIYNFTKRRSILPIDAVLMAGGRGERLRPLTDKVPKPMLKIGSKPIIEHNIDNLMLHGVDDFYITVNYLAEQIIDYFGNGEAKEINIKYINETDPLGTIGSVSLIKEFKNETILIMNSDLFTNINYEDFYQNFVGENADMSVASIPYNTSIPYAVLNYENDIIKSFEEKPTYTFYANAGIYLIKKKLLTTIPINDSYNATDLIQSLIDMNYKIIKYPIVGYWVDIGRLEDYNKVQEFAKHLV